MKGKFFQNLLAWLTDLEFFKKPKNEITTIVLVVFSFFFTLTVAMSSFIYVSEKSLISYVVEKNIANVNETLDKQKEQTLKYLELEMKQNSKTLADASVAYALRGDVANLKYLIWPYTKNSRISMIEIIVGKRSTIAMYRNNSNIIIAREIPSVFRDKELKVESSDLAYNHRKIGVVNIYYQGKAIENALEDEKSRLINKLGLFTQDIKSDASQIFMRHFLIMFIALFVVFSISSLLVAVYYKKHKDQNKLTFEKNIELTIALDNLTKAKNQLVESEKLASLGSLVSGISHEINNPVGVALTAITSLKSRSAKITKKLDNGELTDLDVNEFLDYVVEAVEITHRNLKVTSELVKSFKDISADQQSGEKREIVLKQYIEEIFRSISPEFKQKRHSYDIICDANLKITTYPGVWFQVFANLAGNSVKHGFKDLESGNIIVEVIKRTENTIQIIYQDNGHGINEGVLRKVFDPFFTTNRSQGSGLGLSIVYSLVTQKLKGVITSSNATHGGAKFFNTVPVKI